MMVIVLRGGGTEPDSKESQYGVLRDQAWSLSHGARGRCKP
jgi:hypothetical protein